MHGDADRRNLLFRRNAAGEEELVAIDWVFAGLSVMGADVQNLVVSAVAFSQIDAAEIGMLGEVAYDGYLRGIVEAGWRGDERPIRLGYAASSALIWGIVLCGTLMSRLRNQQPRKREIVDITMMVLEYELQLAEEAKALIAGLSASA